MYEFCHVYIQACCDEAYMSSIFSFLEAIHPDFCSSCSCLRSHPLGAPHILFGSYSHFVFWFNSYCNWGEMEYSWENSDFFFSNEQQLHAHVEAGGQSQVSFLRRRRDECVLEAGFLTGSLVDQCVSEIHLSPPRQP